MMGALAPFSYLVQNKRVSRMTDKSETCGIMALRRILTFPAMTMEEKHRTE